MTHTLNKDTNTNIHAKYTHTRKVKTHMINKDTHAKKRCTRIENFIFLEVTDLQNLRVIFYRIYLIPSEMRAEILLL